MPLSHPLLWESLSEQTLLTHGGSLIILRWIEEEAFHIVISVVEPVKSYTRKYPVFPFCVLDTSNVWLWSWIGIYLRRFMSWAQILRGYQSESEHLELLKNCRTLCPAQCGVGFSFWFSTRNIYVCSSHIFLNKEQRNEPLFFSLIVLYIAN